MPDTYPAPHPYRCLRSAPADSRRQHCCSCATPVAACLYFPAPNSTQPSCAAQHTAPVAAASQQPWPSAVLYMTTRCACVMLNAPCRRPPRPCLSLSDCLPYPASHSHSPAPRLCPPPPALYPSTHAQTVPCPPLRLALDRHRSSPCPLPPNQALRIERSTPCPSAFFPSVPAMLAGPSGLSCLPVFTSPTSANPHPRHSPQPLSAACPLSSAKGVHSFPFCFRNGATALLVSCACNACLSMWVL